MLRALQFAATAAFANAAALDTNVFESLTKGDEPNQDLIFPPMEGKDKLDLKMMIFIPGGKVSTEYYIDTVKAIQEASNLNLWVVVPS